MLCHAINMRIYKAQKRSEVKMDLNTFCIHCELPIQLSVHKKFPRLHKVDADFLVICYKESLFDWILYNASKNICRI